MGNTMFQKYTFPKLACFRWHRVFDRLYPDPGIFLSPHGPIDRFPLHGFKVKLGTGINGHLLHCFQCIMDFILKKIMPLVVRPT